MDQLFNATAHSDGDVFLISQEVTLTRQDVVNALTSAVLARAGQLSRLGTTRLRSLDLDAQVTTNGTEIAGVVATVEARLDPSVVSALALSLPLRGNLLDQEVPAARSEAPAVRSDVAP
jgi:hypothetical protein